MIKKFFTLLCLCTLCIGSAWGNTYTYDFSGVKNSDGSVTNWFSNSELTTAAECYTKDHLGTTATDYYYKDGSKFTFYAGTNFYFSAQKSTSASYFMLGKSGAYVILPKFAGERITNVTLHSSSGHSTNVTVNIYSGNTSASTSIKWGTTGKDYSYDINASYQSSELKVQVTNAYNTQFTTLTIKTEAEDASKVKTPTISTTSEAVDGRYFGELEVGISCETEGAEIHYTTDGTVPTASSATYSAPFNLSSTATVKAIAVKAGMTDSDVFDKTFTFGKSYASLADLVAAGAPTTDGETVMVTLTDETITELVTNGVMLQSGEQAVEIYKYGLPGDWEINGKISGTVICPWKLYNTTWELCPTDLSVFTYKEPVVTKYAITIDPDMENGTIEAKLNGNVVNEAAEGKEITLEVTPDDGYRLKSNTLIVVDENVEEVTLDGDKFTMPASEVLVSAEFETIPTHEVKFFVNGVQLGVTQNIKEGASVEFPTKPENIGTKVFVGWSASTIEGTTNTAPTFVTSATMGTEDITYYAVFVKKEGTEPTLTKLGKDATFSNDDNIVIVATGDSWAKALYQETVSTSYVNFYEFVNNVTEIIADEKNYVTLTGSDNGTWKLGDTTNGYVYNATSNNLTVDKNNSSNWTIAWDESKSKYSIKNGTRWLSCRSDLTGDNQYKFRGGGTSPANGTVYFDIYKLIIGTVTYSNYCTTVPPRKIAVSVSENAATGLTTMYVDYATEIPEGVEAWYVSAYDATEDKLTMTQINGYVPANTAIIVKGTAGESYNFVETFETVDAISGTNLLTGSVTDSEAQTYTIDDGWYYLATSGNFKKYEGIGIVRKAHKAYLQLTERAWSQSAKELTIDWGEPTGIKTIDNGQLTIDNSKAYNLNGVRVNQAYKGIVIMNGKKYINK